MESANLNHPLNAPTLAASGAGAPSSAGYQAGMAPPGQQFSSPLDRFWNLYLIDAERADKKLTDGWKGDTDGILIFTGLFATTVGSFIIAVFPSLSPDLNADTVALLKRIAQHQVSRSDGSQLPIPLPSDSFKAPSSMLRVNILWMLSFFLSLCCALAATLVQQWTRQYLADSQPRGSPSKRGPVHAYLQAGIEKFGFAGCVDSIVTLLHISVFLFVGGLLELAFSLHLTVAYSLLGFAIAGVAVYLILTTLPVLYSDCPYKTPLTLIVRPVKVWYRSSCLFILGALRLPLYTPLIAWLISEESRRAVKRKLWNMEDRVVQIRSRAQTLTDVSQIISCQRPSHVFSQMARSLDEDIERHQYLLTLPSYFESLSDMRYPMKSLPEAGEWYHPLSQILESYTQRRISGSSQLSLQPLEDLIIFESYLLKTQHYLLRLSTPPDGDIVVSDWGSKTVDSLLPPLRKLIYDSWIWHHHLSSSKNPAIRLLSLCRMLPTNLVYPYESSILEYDLPLGSYQGSLSPGDELKDHSDRFLRSFKKSPLKMANLYRLLYFTRAILHHGAEQSELLETYKHIWAPILHGLHGLTLESKPYLLSDETRLYVYELISIVGRDDLLPHPDLGLPLNTRRHDYGAVFEVYPVLGGCLHHHASAPQLGPGRHIRGGVRCIDHGEHYRYFRMNRFESLGIPEGRVSRASI